MTSYVKIEVQRNLNLMKKRIERKMIVYEICLDKIINYSNKVFDIDEKFRKLIRDNSDSSKVKAYTGAKTMFASTLCGHKSINELNDVNKQKRLRFDSLYRKNEFVPCTHGLRDCIIDTDYQQMVEINKSVIQKTKINKIFKKNKIDGLTIMAVDGVDLNETNKEIDGLPEREHKNGHITKYLKNTAFMNVGPLANIIIGMYQHQEIEKITTESGKERAKSNGETKAFEEMIIENEKLIGGVIDGFTLDGLYTNKNVFNLINSMGKYFINRLKNKRLNIYKDAERLFENRKQDYTYELVKIATRKNYKYSKKAKKKDVIKNKIRIEKRDISNNKLGEKRLVNKRTQTRKNSTIEIEIYETVITRKEVWEDIFNMDGYEGDLRVVKSKEISLNGNEEITQLCYCIQNT